MPPSSSTIVPSISARVSINSTRMPRCVAICRNTMNAPMGATSSTSAATPAGKRMKIVTTAAIAVAAAGAKSMNISLMSFTVPSRLRFNRPWMLPVMWPRK